MSEGFSYTLEREKIVAYMKLTPEEKLDWLEDIFLFTGETMNPVTKKVRARFRGNDRVGR